MKISIVQENPVVGDVEGNLRLALKTIDRLKKEGPDVVLFSEMFLTGYPPEDLLLRDDLYLSLDTALEKLAEHSPDINVVIGYPRKKIRISTMQQVYFMGVKSKLNTLSRNYQTIKCLMRKDILLKARTLV